QEDPGVPDVGEPHAPAEEIERLAHEGPPGDDLRRQVGEHDGRDDREEGRELGTEGDSARRLVHEPPVLPAGDGPPAPCAATSSKSATGGPALSFTHGA